MIGIDMERKFDDFKVFRSMLSNLSNVPPNGALTFGVGSYNIADFNIYYTAQLFYSCYLRGIQKSQAISLGKQLTEEKEIIWWNFFVERSDDLSQVANEDFVDTILNVYCPTNMNNELLLAIFKPYMPFFTDVDFLEFGIDNLDNPKFKYFYILLSHLVDEFLPIKINDQILLDDWHDTVLSEQRALVKKFIHLSPLEKKDLALIRIFDAFKQINASHHYEAKLSESYNKVLYDGSYPLNGKIFIPWDKVIFFDGFYFVYHPNFPNGQAGRLPLRVEDSSSRKVFNDLQTHFKKRLLPIYAESRGGHIKKIFNTQTLSECILLMEAKTVAPHRASMRTSESSNKKKEITKTEAKTIIKEFKSRFLDFLCLKQLESYNVICCIETKVNFNLQVNMEYSFIFTIKETS